MVTRITVRKSLYVFCAPPNSYKRHSRIVPQNLLTVKGLTLRTNCVYYTYMKTINKETADKLINIIENGVFFKKFSERVNERKTWHEEYELEFKLGDATKKTDEYLEFNVNRHCELFEDPKTNYIVSYTYPDKNEDDWSYIKLSLECEQQARIMSAMERRIRSAEGVKEETYIESRNRKYQSDNEYVELLEKVVDKFIPKHGDVKIESMEGETEVGGKKLKTRLT